MTFFKSRLLDPVTIGSTVAPNHSAGFRLLNLDSACLKLIKAFKDQRMDVWSRRTISDLNLNRQPVCMTPRRIKSKSWIKPSVFGDSHPNQWRSWRMSGWKTARRGLKKTRACTKNTCSNLSSNLSENWLRWCWKLILNSKYAHRSTERFRRYTATRGLPRINHYLKTPCGWRSKGQAPNGKTHPRIISKSRRRFTGTAWDFTAPRGWRWIDSEWALTIIRNRFEGPFHFSAGKATHLNLQERPASVRLCAIIRPESWNGIKWKRSIWSIAGK